MPLDNFVARIENFFSLPLGEQITVFAYYIVLEKQQEVFTAKDVGNCFDELSIPAHSNISAFLNRNITGRDAKFLKKKVGFLLTRKTIETIQSMVGEVPERKPTNDLIDLLLVKGTRGYLEKIFIEACRCYDEKLYTSSLVMLRKGVEVLIIDIYEKRKERHKIVDSENEYFFLSRLIEILKNDTNIKLGRNAPQALDKIKKFGDMSAHGKFWAVKSDMDNLKENLRIVVAELLNQIDYKNWKS